VRLRRLADRETSRLMGSLTLHESLAAKRSAGALS